jgi:hypothetical protein
MGNLNRERLELMRVFVPELFAEPGYVLYVGAYNRRFFASGALFQAGNKLTVLEVWPDFLNGLITSRLKGRIEHAVLGDVTDLENCALPYDTFDYTVWLHGPEHISQERLVPTLRSLQNITNRTIVCTMPWGRFEHGIAYDNPHTRHLSHWYPEDWQKLHYRVACIGPKDRPNSQLQAWKRA